jgi:hypothetical protein
MRLKYYVDNIPEPKLTNALDRLKGSFDHYYSCGIFYQGLITTLRPLNERVCTCGIVAALKIVKHSKIKSAMSAVHHIKKIKEDPYIAALREQNTRSSHHQEDHEDPQGDGSF